MEVTQDGSFDTAQLHEDKHMIPVVVVEMPLLSQGITCRYCGKPINDDHVYSVEGTAYRCKDCAKKLITKIQELRDDKVCNQEVQQ